jgi:exopolyphosphatase / guanosine-5'-triphosphate,3'-diphosphate pyrophosphatase
VSPVDDHADAATTDPRPPAREPLSATAARATGASAETGGARRQGTTYAALDLGTNNCRLLVARPAADGFRVVDAFSRIVRLGEGLGASNRLRDEAIRRTIEALKICRNKMEARGVARARLIATEACRAAVNGADFIARVRDETDLDLEIVDRETEARLAVAGCAGLADPRAEGVVLFDIGGGSSELVWLDRERAGRRRLPERVRAWTSLPVGVVTLAERHGGVNVTREGFEGMVREVSGLLEGFLADLGEREACEGFHLLGTSGTVTTIAGVHLALPRYDRRQVDGLWMRSDEVDGVLERLLDMDYRGRAANPCIGQERADLVLAGCAILEAIRRAFPAERLRIADRGLREGILMQLMAEDGVWHGRGGRRW